MFYLFSFSTRPQGTRQIPLAPELRNRAGKKAFPRPPTPPSCKDACPWVSHLGSAPACDPPSSARSGSTTRGLAAPSPPALSPHPQGERRGGALWTLHFQLPAKGHS